MPFDDNQFNEMLAPYQAAAKRMMQPYPMLGGGGGVLSQHPMLSKILNESMMGAAFVPPPQGPEGVGGGITRALQGVLGADQFERQRQMQTLMMPYQMMMPRLQAEDIQSQVDERRAMVPFRQEQEAFMRKREDNFDSMMEARERPQAKGHPYASDQGILHQEYEDKDGNVTLKPIGATPTEPQTFFKQAIHGGAGPYEEKIADMRLSSDPAVFAEGEKRAAMHLDTVAAAAGGAEAARKHVEDPYVLESGMIAREKSPERLYNSLGPDPETNPMYSKYQRGIGGIIPDDPMVVAYNKQVKDYRAAKASIEQSFEHYAASTAPRQGVTRAEYEANKSLYPPRNASRNDLPAGDNRGQTTTPASPSSAPNSMTENVDSGAKWASTKPAPPKAPGEDEFLKTLRQSTITDSLRQELWDVYHSTNDPKEFKKNLDKIPIPQNNKDDITDMKFKGKFTTPRWNAKTARYE